jgi:xanthine dehydrogenase accessory factor
MDSKIIQELAQRLDNNEPIAMVTITRTEGSSPRGVGSMMLIDWEGKLLAGTIGGGVLEEKAKEDAAECIRRGISKTATYELNLNSGKENILPMACGGRVDVFIKVFRSQGHLIIVGAGHIGVKLCSLAKILDYHVTVMDDRPKVATKERFPGADEIIVGDISEILQQYPINERSSIVIVTHGHRYDEEALETVVDSTAGYIGMIGSRQKVETCFQHLLAKGVSEERLSRVYAPIGIDIGGETPEEIALSIMAEIQSVRYGKSVPSMKLALEKRDGW